jgi:hypothetical protein
VDEIEDKVVRIRMPISLMVWDVLERRNTDSEFFLCLLGDGTVGLDDDQLGVEDVYAARLLEVLTFVSELRDALQSLSAIIFKFKGVVSSLKESTHKVKHLLGEIDIPVKPPGRRVCVGLSTPAGYNILVKDLDLPFRLVGNLVDKIEHALFAEGDSLA